MRRRSLEAVGLRRFNGPGHVRAEPHLQRPRRSRTCPSSSRCPTPPTPAEYNALAAGGSTAPDLGYLPSQNTPQKPSLGPTQAGPNDSALSSSYTLAQTESWQINYFPENFNSTLGAGGHAGAVFKQLYFRQALQELVDQTGVIATYFKGYGVPTYGPAPVYPPTTSPTASS